MNKNLIGLLALFLGGLGIHKFLLGEWIQGLLYLLFCWTFIPSFISFVEAIWYFSISQEKFDQSYNKK
jgi:TM2 domain-containing membrane protein YozV